MAVRPGWLKITADLKSPWFWRLMSDGRVVSQEATGKELSQACLLWRRWTSCPGDVTVSSPCLNVHSRYAFVCLLSFNVLFSRQSLASQAGFES